MIYNNKTGRASEYRALAGESDSEGIDCGIPSFDIDEYVRLSMETLHGEG